MGLHNYELTNVIIREPFPVPNTFHHCIVNIPTQSKEHLLCYGAIEFNSVIILTPMLCCSVVVSSREPSIGKFTMYPVFSFCIWIRRTNDRPVFSFFVDISLANKIGVCIVKFET